MKKKLLIIIPNIVFITLVIIGIIIVINSRNNSNKTASTIYIDINPSIEIGLDQKDVVTYINPLNDDAKMITTDNIVGEKIENSLSILFSKLFEKGFVREDNIGLIMHIDGKVDEKIISKTIENKFTENNRKISITIIDKITDEDKTLAKEHNISPAKAAYIKGLIKDNQEFTIEELIDKPLNEISESIEFGLYCDEGYSLDHGMCSKVIKTKDPVGGDVCPWDYYEENGICYKEVGLIEGQNYECGENEVLEGKECVNRQEYTPGGICAEGELVFDNQCKISKVIGEAYQFCRDPGRTLYDNRCLATKPSINGGCLGNDMYYNGTCLNLIDDYYMAEWKCPSGEVLSNADGSLKNGDTKCYEYVYVPATLSCEEGEKLIDNMCHIEHRSQARKERMCPNGYQKINDRCLDLTQTTSKVSGHVCEDEDARLEDDKCVYYEVVDAHRKQK